MMMSTSSDPSVRPPDRPWEARAWVEIDRTALLENLATLRARLPTGTALIPMVKADGYGLGVAPLIRCLEGEAPYAYGVASIDEGLELRRLGVERPVLVFSPVGPGDEVRAVRGNLTLCLSDIQALLRLRDHADDLGLGATAHLEIDTGMGRTGLRWDRVDMWEPRLRQVLTGPVSGSHGEPPVALAGLFTHFHSADEEPTRAEATMREQVARFREVRDRLEPLLSEDSVVHLANSAATLRKGALGGSAVRPGIFLYGGGVGEGAPPPRPVVHVRSRVVRVVDVPAGATVGYGATHRAAAPERWATLAIGYGDGLPRVLSNRGWVGIHGHRAPIVGRISMDVTVVDITGLPSTRPGDVATIVGHPDDGAPSLDEIAIEAGTISYEILTGLSARLPRRWLPHT